MKIHSTNYFNTFIVIADDCPADKGETPPVKDGKLTVANRQFELLRKHPYEFTSDDVFFQVYADRLDLTEGEYEEARKEFFSKGQPCFRASPLTKRYGWGIHSNHEGKIAMYGCETEQYMLLLNNPSIKIVIAMKGSK